MKVTISPTTGDSSINIKLSVSRIGALLAWVRNPKDLREVDATIIAESKLQVAKRRKLLKEKWHEIVGHVDAIPNECTSGCSQDDIDCSFPDCVGGWEKAFELYMIHKLEKTDD